MPRDLLTVLLERNAGAGWKVMSSGLVFKYSSDVITTPASGLFTVTFATPFTAIGTALVTLGDANGTAVVSVQGTSVLNGSFTGKAVNASGVGVASIIRVNWLAVGF